MENAKLMEDVSGNNPKTAWQEFANTGHIEDYLKYKKQSKVEEKRQNADENQGFGVALPEYRGT